MFASKEIFVGNFELTNVQLLIVLVNDCSLQKPFSFPAR